jgi:hypothetical protein
MMHSNSSPNKTGFQEYFRSASLGFRSESFWTAAEQAAAIITESAAAAPTAAMTPGQRQGAGNSRAQVDNTPILTATLRTRQRTESVNVVNVVTDCLRKMDLDFHAVGVDSRNSSGFFPGMLAARPAVIAITNIRAGQ